MEQIYINYGLIYAGILISVLAQLFITITYNKYSKVSNYKQMTGRDVARYILDKNGLSNINVVETSGNLTDHYDPSSKVIRLSTRIYREASISSVAVAAHECGHAIQDKNGYLFMRIRSFLVPIVNFASYLGYFAIFIGLLASSLKIFAIGIIMELIILLFQIVTLPVEINASRRALNQLENVLEEDEIKQGKAVLIAAAFTYIASILTTLLQVLRLILIFSGRDDR